ncbi:lipoprotein-releasing ABC transporter ATP-binding protein LolD [Buchnera aphidicola]|uniref:lipoprotein-releasing ABC transporter ATP-binding protein LolD n=1 Tax=Buchnera aphidicola TaxID=9 RepID=UPI003BEED20D
MNNSILLKCVNLSKSYQDGDTCQNILKNISFSLHKGEMIAIIGKSGSGKSTLLHLLGGLDYPTSGKIFFNEISLCSMSSNELSTFRNKKIGFIYQFHHLLLDFNILENVSIPLLINKKNRIEAQEKSYEMLKKVHLEKKIKKYPSELSGGERQRVAIARALINTPSLIIADEPTGNLDQYNINIIFNLMLELNITQNTSFIVVTHDIKLSKKLPTIFKMKNGKLKRYLQ